MFIGMKKLTATVISTASFFLAASKAFALQVSTPGVGIDPNQQGVGGVLSNALTIAYVVGALAVLFYLVLGAFKWITSGGDKEAVGKARATITHALIGLAVLALAWMIVVVVGAVLDINILQDFKIKSLGGNDTDI